MKDVVLDVISNEVMKKLIISEEDFKNYFEEKKEISCNDYVDYLKNKHKN